MSGKKFISKGCAAILLSLVLIAPTVNASARGRDDDRGRGGMSRGGHREIVVVGRDRYHYRDGRFYRPGWFGFEIAVGIPPFGAIVTSIPIGHRTILVGGATYYYYDNVYYTAVPSGYVVVPQPVMVQPAVVVPAPVVPVVAAPPETLTINVPNYNGSYTPVTLVKRGNGYVGPQGEFYSEHPTVEQLRALYGR